MLIPPGKYIIIVPTKPYLRKWVYARYGSPVKLNYHSTIGTIILCLLDKKTFTLNYFNAEKKEIRLAKMTDHIECIKPRSAMYYAGFSLDDNKIIAINRYFEEQFQEELYNFCQNNIKDKKWRPGIAKAIASFTETYGIIMDEDVTLDALKQAEFRHRKNIEKTLQTFVPQLKTHNSKGFHRITA